MLKATSFVDAFDTYVMCREAARLLRDLFGDNVAVLHDALALFVQSPEWHGCDEDADFAALFVLALHTYGYNHLKPEYDVTKDFYARPQALTASEVKPEDV